MLHLQLVNVPFEDGLLKTTMIQDGGIKTVNGPPGKIEMREQDALAGFVEGDIQS